MMMHALGAYASRPAGSPAMSCRAGINRAAGQASAGVRSLMHRLPGRWLLGFQRQHRIEHAIADRTAEKPLQARACRVSQRPQRGISLPLAGHPSRS